ncbi:NAD(P)/FAD-dependent oxidoreductase [Saccharothrix sp. NRRL B-16314]|uniref:NAD(P)/FAD-dependent oxidoreductase n=1 Tax=Saccharothrix sp. NRRL B-16314 TaxID=1463825 RepID=UPI00052540F1|nr:FAD-dependent monooxygenase [Saccharothrix sp. NRRL B-16314]
MPTGHRTRAVVLGGGLAGTLAASVLARHTDSVTIVERDRLPDGPTDRKGTPQARHTHVLVSGGARALDQLLPGTTQALLDRGAQYIGTPNRLLVLMSRGWLGRFEEMQFVIGCSRPLLDWVIRRRVLAEHRITVRQATDAVGLLGDGHRVAGVQVRDRQTGRTSHIEADFVVDATGQGSDAGTWLTDLGLPAPAEQHIDPQVFYSSRIYQAPPTAGDDFPEINIMSDPTRTDYVKAGVLVPIENRQWIVTLVGTRDHQPPTDETGFAGYARSLRHPVIADLIDTATPLTPPRGFRIPGNRRRHFDLATWPQGFVVLGDAACTFNPIYGHGMAIAARSALALDTGLRRHGPHDDTGRIQRDIVHTADVAWDMATRQDLRYPTTVGPSPGALARLQQRFLDRLAWAATGSRAVAAAQLDVYTLSEPPSRLLAPSVILGILLGPRQPARTEPPLTPDEQPALPTPSD